MQIMSMRWVALCGVLFPILGLGADRVYVEENAKTKTANVTLYGDSARLLYTFLDTKPAVTELGGGDFDLSKNANNVTCNVAPVEKVVELEKGLPSTVKEDVYRCSFVVSGGGSVAAGGSSSAVLPTKSSVASKYGRNRFSLFFTGEAPSSMLSASRKAIANGEFGMLCFWSLCIVSFDANGTPTAPANGDAL